ncbi:hypothetical protein V502_00018 [Pseudogymnoascus sp. VKM F-4520 (FW-2644)]|nr:hypothetical protein V502_00018 [Pseudogymnoascus sp. VKM F-4520 (FW-2644)]
MNCPRTSNQERAKWRTECREKLASHIHPQLGIAILPTDVKLITKLEDLYQWSILIAGKAALFNKQLSKHSTGAYIDLCNGAGVHFKAVLAEGAADYEQEKRLVATSIAFDALEKKWRERSNAELTMPYLLPLGLLGDNDGEILVALKSGVVGDRRGILAFVTLKLKLNSLT